MEDEHLQTRKPTEGRDKDEGKDKDGRLESEENKVSAIDSGVYGSWSGRGPYTNHDRRTEDGEEGDDQRGERGRGVPIRTGSQAGRGRGEETRRQTDGSKSE